MTASAARRRGVRIEIRPSSQSNRPGTTSCGCTLTLAARADRRTRMRSAFKNERETSLPMTTYPLEFHRYFEQKWAQRAHMSSACESTVRASRVVAARMSSVGRAKSEGGDILTRIPWLREIGQGLRAEYNPTEQPVPERLAALLKELRGRRS